MATTELSLSQVLEAELKELHGGKLRLSIEEIDREYNRLKKELCKTDGNAAKSSDTELQEQARLLVLNRLIHGLPEKRTALCLSGGGIRSASYGLGILQGLARHNLLDKFHYLSTVSGGGYIGSWLSAWIKRHPKGLDGVIEGLKNNPPKPPTRPEPDPIRHLREYSNYMTPRLGLFSADTWTLVATYIRNLFLNWLMLLPFLMMVVALPRLAVSLLHLDPQRWTSPIPLLGVPIGQAVEIATFGIGFALGTLGLAYIWLVHPDSPPLRTSKTAGMLWRVLRFVSAFLPMFGVLYLLTTLSPEDPSQEPLSWLWLGPLGLVYGFLALLHLSGRLRSTQGHFLRLCLAPMFFAGMFLTTWWAWAHINKTNQASLPILQSLSSHVLPTDIRSPLASVVVFGMLFYLSGWLFYAIAGLGSWIGKDNRMRPAFRSKEFWLPVGVGLLGSAISGAVFGFISWALGGTINPQLESESYACFGTSLFLAMFLLTGFIYIAVAGRWMNDEAREWLGRASGWLQMLLTVWSAVSTVTILGLIGIGVAGTRADSIGGIAGVLSGIITLYFGYTSTVSGIKNDERNADWKEKLGEYGLNLIAFVFSIFILLVLSWLTSQAFLGLAYVVDQSRTTNVYETLAAKDVFAVEFFTTTRWWLVLGAMAFLGFLSLAMSLILNINRFSLHSIYRDRLVRAYLGASRSDRSPDQFTDFDNADNVPMHKLAANKPFHVINIALNLVAGDKLAWQERKADSFTITGLHSGNRELGYRQTAQYGKDRINESLTVGTALAISGAAASPNMGYHSSPAITFLLTLFNVRMGWWLGNPGPAGEKTFRRPSPMFTLKAILAELFGLTDREHQYVYLSDGGHFDNLGLYEMVLRRCKYIVVSDAGRDPDCAFDDLGNAIRKIRIDLGVPIEIDRLRIYSKKSRKLGKYCAVGTIRYSDVDGIPDAVLDKERSALLCDQKKQESDLTEDDRKKIVGKARQTVNGVLIYIKPAISEGEPVDIANYSQINPGFPHEPTSDQWFSESQFESYRMLGSHTINQVCQGGPIASLADFETRANAYIKIGNWDRMAEHAGDLKVTPNTLELLKGAAIMVDQMDQARK